MKKYIYQKPKENNPYYDRECPGWYRDGKIGIFIHWGPYSVPAWAPFEGGFVTIAKLAANYDLDSVNMLFNLLPQIMMDNGIVDDGDEGAEIGSDNPYAEWYWNSLGYEGGQTYNYHKETYGDKKYEEFGKEFEDACKDWDSDTWGELFSEAGAKYVVVTSKHHDGFCLWPTDYPNPKIPNWNTKRDLLGDLKTSLEKKDIRLSLYYSAGLDWSLSGVPMGSLDEGILQDDESIEYFDNQVIELIDKYKPGYIWEDIGYPENGDFNKILEHYYKVVPDGVMNDRAQNALSGKSTRHFDVTTTEYFVPNSIREVPWEVCRGISSSFAYNKNDDESTTLSAADLVESLADIISKNGNLLLGLGPKADGSIPELQVKVMKEFGKWVKVNEDAIYGTRPYKRFDDKALSGNDVRYTTKGDKLNAFIIGSVQGEVAFEHIKIKPGAVVNVLGEDQLKCNEKGHVEIKAPTNEYGCVLQFNITDVEY